MKVKVLSETPNRNDRSKIDQINKLRDQIRNIEKQMDGLPPGRSPKKVELSKQIDDIRNKIRSIESSMTVR